MFLLIFFAMLPLSPTAWTLFCPAVVLAASAAVDVAPQNRSRRIFDYLTILVAHRRDLFSAEQLEVQVRGIPHLAKNELAKNERDVGHPAFRPG
jgi:hypothetical protein